MFPKSTLRLFQKFRLSTVAPAQGVATKAPQSSRRAVPVLLGSLAVGAGLYGVGKYASKHRLTGIGETIAAGVIPPVAAADLPTSQPSVYSQGKNHALYLWIDLSPTANAKDVAKVTTKLQVMVDQVTDPKLRDEEDEIWAGVGFGPTFYKQAGGSVKEDFVYAHRRGNTGDMPSSKGDVFVHAKCNTPSKLFELAQVFLSSLPAGSVRNFEDIYSFVYQNGRDLSGFIDGTENAADEDDRQKIAVEAETGGSYVITQKWVHDMKMCSKEKDKTLESFIGRTKQDSTELSRKTISSHVARMTGGNSFQQKKPFEIVRQSMPYGNHSSGAGLFFIGYSASPSNLNFMLDQMVGAGNDGHCDDIMRLTKNIKGTYWYFPGAEELKKFA